MLLERVRGAARFRWDRGRPRAWTLDEEAVPSCEIRSQQVMPTSTGEHWWAIETETMETASVEVHTR